ncbi:unnamed protein product [Leptosia nina]|uniref:Uncharacterized protein n=1 Tax=Leptosia nina TaxID=320188 RepID=A0AAV1K659_9NEOP
MLTGALGLGRPITPQVPHQTAAATAPTVLLHPVGVQYTHPDQYRGRPFKDILTPISHNRRGRPGPHSRPQFFMKYLGTL